MHKGLYWLLLITFISIAVFGFVAMGSTGTEHAHNGCIAATARVSTCESVAYDFLFHISVFKSFSQAMIGSSMILIALMLFLFGISQSAPDRIVSLVSYIRCNGQASRYRIQVLSDILQYRARAYFMKWCSLQRGDAQHALARAYEESSSSVL